MCRQFECAGERGIGQLLLGRWWWR